MKSSPGFLLFAVIGSLWFARAQSSAAGIRLAIVATDAGAETSKVLDLAIAEFKGSKDIEVLERAQIDRVLREQEVSLGNRVPDAERAVKAGQVLRVDLFVVLEGGGPRQTFGVVVFDAQTGVRYADSAVAASNVLSAARGVARVTGQAAGKSRRRSTDLRTVGVLSMRNADLPRAYDSLCDTAVLLLERELVSATDIAVLERRRLEHVSRERGVVNGAGDALLPSLRMLDLEFARQGDGVRASVALTSLGGQFRARTNVSITTLDTAALSRRLAEAVAGLLDVKMPALPAGRLAEAQRFGREAEILTTHRDYEAAVRAMEAAYALDPAHTNYPLRLVQLLPDAAMEILDPGGQRWSRGLTRKLSGDELSLALSLGHRGADLLRALCLEAAAQFKPKQPVPWVMKSDAIAQPWRLMEKLADPTLRGTAYQSEMDALARKEREIRIEIIEPFLRTHVRDKESFDRYSGNVSWFALNNRLGAYDRSQWRRDAALVTHRWLEVAKRFNSPDGSGNYAPLYNVTSAVAGGAATEDGALFEPVWVECDAAKDPVLRAFGKFGRAMPALKQASFPNAQTIEAERALRLWLQGEIARRPAGDTDVRSKLFSMIEQALNAVMNHKEDWKEYWSACQFALEQRAARPVMFNTALVTLSTGRNNRPQEIFQLADGILKLISERPEAFSERDRNQTGAICRQYRDRYASAVGAKSNALVPWTRAVELFAPSPRRDGLGWLFCAVAGSNAVHAVCLGLTGESNRNEVIQLVRIPFEGSGASLLGRTEFHDAIAANMHRAAEFAWRTKPDRAKPIQIQHPPRAACVGAGRYFLATHLGVFIFPLEGGPPERLCATNGLPSDDARSVAFLNGKLYIGAGEPKRVGYLVEYDLATKAVKTLASSRRKEVASPFDDQIPFEPAFLWSDEAHQRVLMLAATTWSNALGGWWSFAPDTGEFRQVAPTGTRSVFGTWGGQVAPQVIGNFDLLGFSLWDTDADRFLLKYAHDNRNQKPSPLWPAWHEGGAIILHPPMMLHQGWLWWAVPFQRVSLDGTKREEFPPLSNSGERINFLQVVDGGKRVLAADRAGVWLLELSLEETASGQKSPVSNTPNAK